MADEVPFSEKFTEIEELPERHPLRIRYNLIETCPVAGDALEDFYRMQSNQPQQYENTPEKAEWMGHLAMAFGRLQVAALRKPGL